VKEKEKTMHDLDTVVQMIFWVTGADGSALAGIREDTLKTAIAKLTQPLAAYLIQCQELEKAGLWEKVAPLGIWDPPDNFSAESEKLRTFAATMQNVFDAMSDIPEAARAPLLRQLIPHLEQQLTQQYPGYRMLV
jgi:hypothetical protein